LEVHPLCQLDVLEDRSINTVRDGVPHWIARNVAERTSEHGLSNVAVDDKPHLVLGYRNQVGRSAQQRTSAVQGLHADQLIRWQCAAYSQAKHSGKAYAGIARIDSDRIDRCTETSEERTRTVAYERVDKSCVVEVANAGRARSHAGGIPGGPESLTVLK